MKWDAENSYNIDIQILDKWLSEGVQSVVIVANFGKSILLIVISVFNLNICFYIPVFRVIL